MALFSPTFLGPSFGFWFLDGPILSFFLWEQCSVKWRRGGSFPLIDSVTHCNCHFKLYEQLYLCLWMCLLIYFSFVCLHVCAYAFKFKVHCGSAFEPGASGVPGRATSGGAVHIHFVTSAVSFAVATKEPEQAPLHFLLSSPLTRVVSTQTVRSSMYLTTAAKACQFILSNSPLLTEGRRTLSVLPIVVGWSERGCCSPPSMRKRKKEVTSGPETGVSNFFLGYFARCRAHCLRKTPEGP